MTPRTISILVLMQLLTVLLGVLLTAIFLRFLEPDRPAEPAWLPGFPHFMRDYGFWLCLLPFAWAGLAVLSVRSVDALPQIQRAWLGGGWFLWAALAIAFAIAVCMAHGAAFGSRPIEMP